tara:strand:- start:340 stop:543 length:204 start_codon:yes stop_codon:yes gene_type:complete
MSADKIEKFFKALFIVKDKVEIVTEGLVETEEDFNKIKWKQDDNSFSTNNPHSDITWTKVKAEMDKL